MTEQSDDPCADLPEGAFCDGFDGPALDLEKWWYGRKVWGLENHGVIPENVRVQEGQVWFASNGDSYSGDLQGVRKTGGSYVQDQPGQRVGGVIVSDRYFGPGRYEFRMALPDETGVCSALWTYHYQELYSDHPAYDDANHASLPAHGSADDGWYKTPNHEIDIEIPTALAGEPDDQASYRNARYNTWVGETVYTDEFHDNGYAYNDGAFHTWRFDWHTGDDPRVDFYVDGQQMHRSTTDIPRVHGRLWLGTWFPLWAGSQANFDVTHLKLDWVRFTPFDEPVLTPPETYAGDGLTRCRTQAENDMGASHCALTEF